MTIEELNVHLTRNYIQNNSTKKNKSMNSNTILLLFFIIFSKQIFAQTYPTFGTEIPVTITGLTFDAMEPSISPDGNTIFFNSLNDGITTSLYYATKVNDSTFTFIGELAGANETTSPRMDAVASSDSANNFFWNSLRNFPTSFDNYFHGKYNGTDVTDIGRLHGTFYIYSLGWLVMDASINYDGTLFYYCNAFFNTDYSSCSGLPCEAKLGVAQKENDSTFNKLSNSDLLFQNINDVDYLVYAPAISKDGLQIYFTRILISSPVQSEICVAVRNSSTDPFSIPSVIYASNLAPEAPTLTTDQTKMYYHKKVSGQYRLFLRRNTSIASIDEKVLSSISVYPNPTKDLLSVIIPNPNQEYTIEIRSTIGQLLLSTSKESNLDLSNFSNGLYMLMFKQGGENWVRRIIKQ